MSKRNSFYSSLYEDDVQSAPEIPEQAMHPLGLSLIDTPLECHELAPVAFPVGLQSEGMEVASPDRVSCKRPVSSLLPAEDSMPLSVQADTSENASLGHC
jgi:hypothetical protein